MSDKSIKIIGLNVRGLGNERKRKEVFNYIRQWKADIACLQETHFTQAELKLVKMQWRGNIYSNSGSSQTAGVAILINPDVDISVSPYYSDEQGRIQMVEIQKENLMCMLTNLYGPNMDMPELYHLVLDKIRNCDSVEHIVVGDLNVVLNPKLDNKNGNNNAPKARQTLQKLLDELEVIDYWRVLNPDKRIYSWTCKKALRNEILGSRIDYILTSHSLVNKIQSISYGYGYKTDHSIVQLQVCYTNNPRGPGYWKFNKLLLHDKQFVNKANKIIEQALTKYALAELDNQLISGLEDITQLAKSWSKAIAKAKKEKYNKLVYELDKLKQESIVNASHSIANYTQQIKALLEEKTKAAAFRSKAKYSREYEKNSKFFFSLEKSKYNKKTMTTLEVDSIKTKDPQKIL